MNITEYAKSELERLGKDKEGMQELINKDILELWKDSPLRGIVVFRPVMLCQYWNGY